MKAYIKETRELVDVIPAPGADTGIKLYQSVKDDSVLYFDYELELVEYYGN